MKRRLLLAALLCCCLGGCARYYKVSDPGTDKSYFTTKVDQRGSGAVKFVDTQSGESITLQSSEVKRISKDEYKAATAPK